MLHRTRQTSKTISTARRRVELRKRGYNVRGERDVTKIPLSIIYEDMRHIRINDNSKLTAEASRQADLLFDDKIRRFLKRSKRKDKREFWRCLYHSLRQASWDDSCVAYDRNLHKTTKLRLQVIQAADCANLVHNVVSLPGSPKTSRLLPLPDMEKHFSADPWGFDGDKLMRFVFLSVNAGEKVRRVAGRRNCAAPF